MLVAGEAVQAAALKNNCQSAQGQGRKSAAVVRLFLVGILQASRPRIVEISPRHQMGTPAVAGDGHFHDLRRAFINGSNTHVALDFLHHIFPGIAIAAQGLDGIFSRFIPRFRAQEFGHGPFRLQSFLSTVQAFGDPFDVSARRFQSRRVGHDEFMGVALFLIQGSARLYPFVRITNRSFQSIPARAKTKGAHHQTCIAEHRLGLGQPLAFFRAHQALYGHKYIFQEQRGRITGAYAMFIFRFTAGEAICIALDDEPGGAAWSQGQDGV